MNFPFIKKKQAGIIVENIKSDHVKEHGPEEESDDLEGIKAAAADLLQGIEAGDVNKIAMALHAAFEIMDSMPHVEGEHLESDKE